MDSSQRPRPARAYRAHDPRQVLGRLAICGAAGLAMAWLLRSEQVWGLPSVAGWDVGAALFTGLSWWIIARHDAAQTHARAAADDPGRRVGWALTVAASVFSLFASIVVLRSAPQAPPARRDLLVGLSLGGVALAWLVTHTASALRYAHLYYRDREERSCGGLEFPGGHPPSYMDFAYFAFTIGMCFQVSDVTISSPNIRRAVLGHALLSFVYSTTIVALALNVVFGLFQGGAGGR
jgi:uncharacterized membrane protein